MSAAAATRRFGGVRAGENLPVLERHPTRLTIFLFGVAYWTAHRIHYDVEHARAEGFADVLVTSNLLSAYLATLATDWAGDRTCLRRLEDRNVAPAIAGDVLRVRGYVSELEPTEGGGLVHCALTVAKDDGTVVVTGRATLALPD